MGVPVWFGSDENAIELLQKNWGLTPIAAAGVLGLVKIGTGLSIAADGTLSVPTTPPNTTYNIITANTTKNVPNDFPTLAAAISYAANSIIVNDAILTITVAASYAEPSGAASQVFLDGVDLRNVVIQSQGAAGTEVTINATSFATNFQSVAAWLVGRNAFLPTIIGNWKITGANALFVGGNNSQWAGGQQAPTGGVASGLTIVGANNLGTWNEAGNFRLFGMDSSGAHNSTGGGVTNAGSTIIRNGLNLSDAGVMNFYTHTGGSPVSKVYAGASLGAAVALNGQGAQVNGGFDIDVSAAPTANVFTIAGGAAVGYDGGAVTLGASASGKFANLTQGSALKVGGTVSVTGTSTGARFAVAGSSMVQNNASFTGFAADNITDNAISAGNGLILT